MKFCCPHCKAEVPAKDLIIMPPDESPLVRYNDKNIPRHAGMSKEEFLSTRDNCNKPPLRELYRENLEEYMKKGLPYNYVFGAGDPETAKIVMIGEAPGAIEDQCGVPFSGPAGQCLSSVLNAAKISRVKDVYLINTSTYAPPGKGRRIGKPTSRMMAEQRQRVIDTIQALHERPGNPLKAVVCLGKYAWMQLVETDKVRNAVESNSEVNMNSFILGKHKGWHHGKFEVAVPLLLVYHPSFIMRKWNGGRGGNEARSYMIEYKGFFEILKEKIDG